MGEKWLNQAIYSAESVKKHTDLPICLFTDEEFSHPIFDEIKVVEREGGNNSYDIYLDRIKAMRRSPFDFTLALDTDTVLLDDITELFSIVDCKFVFAACHGHLRAEKHAHHMKILPNIPSCFAPIQCGVLLFNWKFQYTLEQWYDQYKAKQFRDDQGILRYILWNTTLPWYVLPEEYNLFDWNRVVQMNKNPRIATPKIFHYTRNEDTIKKLVAYYNKKEFKYEQKTITGSYKTGTRMEQ